MRYNTAGRRRLAAFMESHSERPYTVEEIYAAMTSDGYVVGKSSLYRLAEQLCAEGILRKFRENEQSAATFQYVGSDVDCASHLHLKCELCGRLIHLECSMSRELLSHILREHGFRIDSKKSVLLGKCGACGAKELSEPSVQ